MDVLMDGSDVAAAIDWQADHAAKNDAPCTGRVVRAQLALLDGATETGRRLATWPGKPLEDALPLRLAGGFHHLVLSGADTRLLPVYRGELTDQAAIDALVFDLTRRHDAALLPWLDGPPQTNEAGRSASIMAALLWLSPRLGPRFELNELGASAGVNTMMERYFYDLGGTIAGPATSPMRIVPEWRGPAPGPASVDITVIQGCDRAPINLADPTEALRLRSYVWAEVTERLARIDAAIALAQPAAAEPYAHGCGRLGGPAPRRAAGRGHCARVLPFDRLAISARGNPSPDLFRDHARRRRRPAHRVDHARNQPADLCPRAHSALLAGRRGGGATRRGARPRCMGGMARGSVIEFARHWP